MHYGCFAILSRQKGQGCSAYATAKDFVQLALNDQDNLDEVFRGVVWNTIWSERIISYILIANS